MILSFFIVFINVPFLYVRTKRIACAIYIKHIWIKKENFSTLIISIDIHKSANIILFSIFSILFIFLFLLGCDLKKKDFVV